MNLDKEKRELEFYFSDPRVEMGFLGRLVIRVVGFITLIVFAVVTFSFLISKSIEARYLGILFLLFLADYFIHRKEARKNFNFMPLRGRINLAEYVTPSAFASISKALDRIGLKRTNFYLELFAILSGHRGIKDGLERLDVPLEEFNQKLDEFIKDCVGQKIYSNEEIKKITEKLVIAAAERAIDLRHAQIECGDVFSALGEVGEEEVNRILNLFSINPENLEQALVFASIRDQFNSWKNIPRTIAGFVMGGKKQLRHRIMNRAWTSRPTPTLDAYSTDFTDLAREEEVGFLIGHKEEYERLVDALARPVNPNALLVGEAGIGKEVIVTHLAWNLSKDLVPANLFDKRLVMLDLSGLVAGAAPEELQLRLQIIVKEIERAGNIILYIPDIHNLVKTSGTAYLSAADALLPVIRSNAFPIVGSTYPKEFKEALQPRSDLNSIFESIRVNEVSIEEAVRLLSYESLILEKQTKIKISFGAISKAVELAKRYFRNRFLPSSASDLLKDAVSEARRFEEEILRPERVIATAETKVKIPIRKAGKEEAEKLLKLEEIIHERLIDQVEAVKAVSNVLREYRSGLAKAGGPIASFLFVGPTGVGKTELAKILAGVQFGSREAMIRFDMTEYQDKQSFYRFIGSPDGKISGALTDAVLEKPYSLILLDEFEKAFPDILDLFLQVFDDGRLTDNLGRVVDFENTIIIATSNAHSDIINESLRSGQTMSQIAEYLKKKLTDVFKPELLNRFSKIVVFNNLSPEDLKKVALINLKDFAKIVENQGILIEFDPEAVKRIAQLGYDPEFGARPLQRVIADKLRAPLAEKILKQEAVKGAKLKVVLKGENEFEFVNQ